MRKPSRLRGICVAALAALLTAAAVFASSRSASAYTYKVLHAFCSKAINCSDGMAPAGRLAIDSRGNLYGTAFYGGNDYVDQTYANGDGTIFQLIKSGSSYTYKKLYNFCSRANCTDGKNPNGALIVSSGGALYGTTVKGGSGGGTIFRLYPQYVQGSFHWHLTTLHSFGQLDAEPISGLTYLGQETGARYDDASPLFGTTPNGGSSGAGTVFELSGKGLGSYADLHQFAGADGKVPLAELAFDAKGNLFGTTMFGGAAGAGTIFEIYWSYTIHGTVVHFTTLYSFCSQAQCLDGQYPQSALTLNTTTGDLVGTAQAGGYCAYDGAFGDGTMFDFAPYTKTLTNLWNFCGDEGSSPQGKLLLDGPGNIFGTATGGGVGYGTAFQRDPNNNLSLHDFCSEPHCADGNRPIGGLVSDASGNLFGVTSNGGTTGYSGVVFELSP